MADFNNFWKDNTLKIIFIIFNKYADMTDFFPVSKCSDHTFTNYLWLYLTAGYFMVLKLLRCCQFIDISTKHFQQLPNLKCLGLFSMLYFIWDIGMMLVDTMQDLSRDSGLIDKGQAEYHRHIKQHRQLY